MSKEMAVIALGALVILTRTFLGLPGSWQTVVLTIAGAAIMVIGFLLRGEALSRQMREPHAPARKASYPFADNMTEQPSASSGHEPHDRITSLN